MMITVLTLSIVLPTSTNIISQQQAAAQTNDDSNFKLYENPTYGIQIQYHFDWTIKEGDEDIDDDVTDIVSFVATVRNDSETYEPYFDISYTSVDIPLSSNVNENLNQYLTTTINDYNDTLNDFEVIESSTNSVLGGLPAYKLVFTYVDDDIYYERMEIGTIIGDKVYFVTYESEEEEQYSDYLPTIQKMIDSLKVNASNN
jgi:hypothetical protein